MEKKASAILINLALIPFAFMGILFLGTCALCVSVPFLQDPAPVTQGR